jgi:hypothetical protein
VVRGGVTSGAVGAPSWLRMMMICVGPVDEAAGIVTLGESKESAE